MDQTSSYRVQDTAVCKMHVLNTNLSRFADPHSAIDSKEWPPKQIRFVHASKVGLGLKQSLQSRDRERLERLRAGLAGLLGVDVQALNGIVLRERVEAVSNGVVKEVLEGVQLIIDSLGGLGVGPLASEPL